MKRIVNWINRLFDFDGNEHQSLYGIDERCCDSNIMSYIKPGRITEQETTRKRPKKDK